MASLDASVEPIKPETWLGTYGPILTALGPGDPLFAAYYPSCRSVFGLHDDSLTEAEVKAAPTLLYTVYGWFSEGIVEPLANMVAGLRNDTTAALSLLVRDAKKNHATAPPTSDVDLTEDQWNQAFRLAADERFGWRVDTSRALAFPTNIVCAGATTIGPATEAASDTVPTASPIAVGSTPAEALAALLLEKMPLAPPDEDRLVQALAATDLKNHSLDLGLKLAEARHTEQFRAYRGHSIWVIRPSDADGASEGGEVSLPDELAHELNVLNELQEEFDRAHDAINGLRQELFSDWSRYMKQPIQKATRTPLAVDVDAARDLAERTRLKPLELLQRRTGLLSEGAMRPVASLFRTHTPARRLAPCRMGQWLDQPTASSLPLPPRRVFA